MSQTIPILVFDDSILDNLDKIPKERLCNGESIKVSEVKQELEKSGLTIPIISVDNLGNIRVANDADNVIFDCDNKYNNKIMDKLKIFRYLLKPDEFTELEQKAKAVEKLTIDLDAAQAEIEYANIKEAETAGKLKEKISDIKEKNKVKNAQDALTQLELEIHE